MPEMGLSRPPERAGGIAELADRPESLATGSLLFLRRTVPAGCGGTPGKNGGPVAFAAPA